MKAFLKDAVKSFFEPSMNRNTISCAEAMLFELLLIGAIAYGCSHP